MELLRELTALQSQRGWLDDGTLRDLAKRRGVPLYQIEGLVSFYPLFRRSPPPRVTLHICRDVVCAMAGCAARRNELLRRLAGQESLEIHEVSCLGRCDRAPAALVNESPLPAATTDTWLELLEGTRPLPDDSAAVEPRTWRCDPYSASHRSYTTIDRLGASAGDECLARLNAAGLRGMGGAGFPTGRKWELVRRQPTTPKYVICNADESEPGTFKDRVILEQLPHLVIEGMVLAALTVGAETGIVYLRHEYERERQILAAEIERARHRGVLGADVAGTGRPFDIEIFVSPGGYILGEETALLEALEDKRGEPRNKPPYPGTHGLWGRPTLINNVETFALATAIIARGVDWWRAQGQAGRPGLKFVSISGDVRQPGVHEIPLGMPVRELIELAGGMREGGRLQAFLPGGASSNFLPAERVDTPLDFEDLKAAGSMLGTGAVIIISDQHDLFELATNLVRFFRNESCGKCVPCRLGCQQAVRILEGVGRGELAPAELAVLPALAHTLEQTSICGLGQVALNPVLSLRAQLPGVWPSSP